MYEGERFGPYVLREKIAQGGMAEIFFGERRGAMDFRREVCIKRIRPNLCGDPSFVEMFIDEARICSRLRHSNIVAIDDFGNTDGQLYICMEWVHGTDVGRLLKRLASEGRRMPVDAALFVLSEVLRGLEYAHGKHEQGVPLGIVHRDVTPHNVLVSYAGEVKLSDFGIAKATSRLHQTQGDLVKGKLPYMAPEQATGKTLDGRTDLFALGICAYEILTGQRPFQGKERDVIFAMLQGERAPLRSLRPDVPPAVERWVDRLLEREMSQRFHTAAVALDALHEIPFPAGARALTALLSELYPDQASVVTPVVGSPPTPLSLDSTRPQRPAAHGPLGTDVLTPVDDSGEQTAITPPPVFTPVPPRIDPGASSAAFAATATSSAARPVVAAPPPTAPLRRLALPVTLVTGALLGVAVARAVAAPAAPTTAPPAVAPPAVAPPAVTPSAVPPPVVPPPVVTPPAVAPAVAVTPPVPALATLVVTVQPWGNATLDGRPVATGRPLRVAAGTHTVGAAQPGGRATARRVTLAPGESSRVRIEIPR